MLNTRDRIRTVHCEYKLCQEPKPTSVGLWPGKGEVTIDGLWKKIQKLKKFKTKDKEKSEQLENAFKKKSKFGPEQNNN